VVACVIIASNRWAVACWPPLSNVPPLAGDAKVAGMSDADVAAVGTFVEGLATGK
jgi:hypothetical protein